MSEPVNVYFGEECDHLCTYVTESAYDDLSGDYDALRAENETLIASVENHQLHMLGMARDRDQLRSELAALKAVPDGVEVVGYRWLDTAHFRAKIPAFEHAYGPHKVAEWHALMTVAQHNAIVAALRQPVADEREAFCDGHCTWLDHHPSCTALSAPAAGQDVSALVEALEAIRNMTNADDPDSYRCDDREGCLDTVHSVSDAALAARKAGGGE